MDSLMNEKEVALLLGLRPQTLSIWRMKKEKLPFVKIGRRIGYRKSDIEKWLEAQTIPVGEGR